MILFISELVRAIRWALRHRRQAARRRQMRAADAERRAIKAAQKAIRNRDRQSIASEFAHGDDLHP